MLRKDHGDLNNAPTKEEIRGRLTGERDKTKFIDLRLERWQFVGLRKGRRQDIP